ncbi:MAG: bifunctional DNA-formamidopyrimidine glycosylase/DNA-(apurinic or apyrimidinic site) lyase [Candidatus Dormibacteraceae bacterium]
MPELPEVETVARDLRPLVLGRRVERVDVRMPSVVRYPDTSRFAAGLEGLEFGSLGRRGKYLLFPLGGPLLVVHLGMTGQLRLVDPGTEEPDHLHVVVHLDGGDQLRYRDPRRFGRLLLGTQEELVQARAMPRLGPEPIDPDFTGAVLWQRVHRRRAPIKALLLEQTMVAGVGNIYADEALFRARIRPLRRADTLSRPAVRRLAGALRQVLGEAIGNRGSSVADYRDIWGEMGGEQDRLLVYGRAGEPCVRCGRPLRLGRIGGRSSVWCGWCQR